MVILPTEKRFEWEHAPVVLFCIVLLNILIFALYQSNDDAKFERALVSYEQLQYLDYEWPIFETYLSEQGDGSDSQQLQDLRELYQQQHTAELGYYVLSDAGFYHYLKANRQTLPVPEDFGYWENRAEIHDQIQSVSYLAYGLKPNDLNPITLLTHQFLHGDTMHLMGNLFFLVICGFAVEAAIGHWRFLLFYLISGAAGGLLYMALNLNSPTTLVGASGAISGVMAMYLGVFRLKKIEFFYWFFIFVGYFRAPALFILPFYIGKELYSYMTDLDSNVAFMAHTGGFLAGGLLIMLALVINSRMLDEEYIEEDQQIDPRQQDLAQIYLYLEKYRFDSALKAIDKAVQKYGPGFDFSLLRYNLLKLKQGDAYNESVLAILREDRLRPHQLKVVDQIWHDNPELQSQLDDETLLKLGWKLTALPDISTADQIFALLNSRETRGRPLGHLARKLARMHGDLGNNLKQKRYAGIADQLQQA
ncbi:rhomboid family intramembrane serine protease [Motiliproteus sp.]|uniref:rhomboid family intramembrane serine protease n=1 Tax=Motiliproteus sp. TaxID=1898955 RepID=UPI003BA94040